MQVSAMLVITVKLISNHGFQCKAAAKNWVTLATFWQGSYNFAKYTTQSDKNCESLPFIVNTC